MVEDPSLLTRHTKWRERFKGSGEVGGDTDVEVKLEVTVMRRGEQRESHHR